VRLAEGKGLHIFSPLSDHIPLTFKKIGTNEKKKKLRKQLNRWVKRFILGENKEIYILPQGNISLFERLFGGEKKFSPQIPNSNFHEETHKEHGAAELCQLQLRSNPTSK
jgi:hypothetical protein